MEYLEILMSLLEKQEVMYARMSLSDDEEAQTVVENMRNAVVMLGGDPDLTVNDMFMDLRNKVDAMMGKLRGEELDARLFAIYNVRVIGHHTTVSKSIRIILCLFPILSASPMQVLSFFRRNLKSPALTLVPTRGFGKPELDASGNGFAVIRFPPSTRGGISALFPILGKTLLSRLPRSWWLVHRELSHHQGRARSCECLQQQTVELWY